MTDIELAVELAGLLRLWRGRAIGLWAVEEGALAQRGFVACPEMPREVAERFAEATRRVPLERAELSIVQAAVTGAVVVARVAQWPVETGSGYWLRQFGAARSVAVPLAAAAGGTWGVLSLALADETVPATEVAAALGDAGASWLDRATR